MTHSANLKVLGKGFRAGESTVHLLEEVLAAHRPEWVRQLPEEWQIDVLDVLWDSRVHYVPVHDPELAKEWEERLAAAEKSAAELEKVLNAAGVDNARALIEDFETAIGLLNGAAHRAIYRQGLRDGVAVAGLVGLLTKE